MRLITTTFWLAILPVVVSAHHGRSEFSDDIRELEGEVVDITWANPHPYVSINVVNADGIAELWRIEMFGNLFQSERQGIRRDLFSQGDPLRAAGQPSTRRNGYMLANNLLFEDGREAVVSIRARPRWTDRLIRAEGSAADEELRPDQAADENRGIFRVWTPQYYARVGTSEVVEAFKLNASLTDSALVVKAEWDELDSFLTRCEQPGMPLIMMTPQEREFVDEGDSIRVLGQYFDTIRTVHLQDSPDPEDQPATHFGYSVGHWDEATLVIETTRINWPYFYIYGTPQSEAVHVIERYTPSDDLSRLNVHITITDPATFTQPATFEIEWFALGRTIKRYDCQVF